MTEQTTAATPLVEAVPLASLPKASRGEMTDADKALSTAIAAAAVDGNAAKLPTVYDDRKAATVAGSRLKRLLRKAGVVPAGKAARIQLIPAGEAGKVQIAAYFGDPGKPVPKGKDKSNGSK